MVSHATPACCCRDPCWNQNRTTWQQRKMCGARSIRHLLSNSGSDSGVLIGQSLAESRVFPRRSEPSGEQSLLKPPQWRTGRDENFRFGFAGLRTIRTRSCMPIFSRPPQHQTEPPKRPTETNAGISPNRPSNKQSLVRDRKTRSAKTPRIRAFFRERL